MPDDPRRAALLQYRDQLMAWNVTAVLGEPPPAPPPLLADDPSAQSHYAYALRLVDAERRGDPLPLPTPPAL